jgi:hypothetical protein
VRLTSIAVASALFLSSLTCAAQEGGAAPPDSIAKKPSWTYSATGMYYSLKDYEALDAGSMFAGWKFSGGDKLTYDVTPILGGLFGAKQGIAPGLEASVVYGITDFYTEAEHVYDTGVKEDSFTYAWSELGFSPLEWLRFGLVGQRTRLYSSSRDIQQGGFAQFITPGKLTFGLYVFNPDLSADRFAVFSLASKF